LPPALTWRSSPTTRPSGQSSRSRSSNAALEAAGAHCKDSPTSRSSSPTCPPRPNGGLSKPDALRGLFNGHAWLPPGLEPAG
jgi:hypothetical protein